MANEISYAIQGRLKNGNLVDDIGSQSFSFDQAVKDSYRKILSVTTTGVSMATGLTTNGYALFINLDATNYVSIGGYPGSVLDSVIKLKPGRFALFPLDPAATIRLQANTATCLVDTRVWSD